MVAWDFPLEVSGREFTLDSLNRVPRADAEHLYQSTSQKSTLAQGTNLSDLIGQFLNDEKF